YRADGRLAVRTAGDATHLHRWPPQIERAVGRGATADCARGVRTRDSDRIPGRLGCVGAVSESAGDSCRAGAAGYDLGGSIADVLCAIPRWHRYAIERAGRRSRSLHGGALTRADETERA